MGDEFFRCLIRAAVHDLTSQVLPLSQVASVIVEFAAVALSRAAWDWLKTKSFKQKQAIIDAIARMPFEQAASIVDDEIRTAPVLGSDKAALRRYLSIIPMSFRNAINRFDDHGTPTTLISQIPRCSEDILRFMPIRPPRFQPGDLIPTHDYRLAALLGQGGFGEVWRARNRLRPSQPDVAIKFCFEPKLLVSLKKEIDLLERLRAAPHPGDYVQLRETAFGADPPFLVYEFVDGSDLAGWLASFHGASPPVEDVVRVLKMSARAIAYAHSQGIVHRDLKPANLLVTSEGRVKVCDFGIGAVVGRGGVFPGALRTATILRGAATPLYADPRRHPDGDPHPIDDIYAIGVIGYQLLVGNVATPVSPAWRAELREAKVPDGLANIIGACLDVRHKRLPHGGALLSALSQISRAPSPSPAPVAAGTTAPRVAVAKAAVSHCIACGSKVEANDSFCVRCGRRLTR